jgi:hypothetical protein
MQDGGIECILPSKFDDDDAMDVRSAFFPVPLKTPNSNRINECMHGMAWYVCTMCHGFMYACVWDSRGHHLLNVRNQKE